jgi:hypothetical protein
LHLGKISDKDIQWIKYDTCSRRRNVRKRAGEQAHYGPLWLDDYNLRSPDWRLIWIDDTDTGSRSIWFEYGYISGSDWRIVWVNDDYSTTAGWRTVWIHATAADWRAVWNDGGFNTIADWKSICLNHWLNHWLNHEFSTPTARWTIFESGATGSSEYGRWTVRLKYNTASARWWPVQWVECPKSE